jgi:hypothetical protein
MVVTGSGAPTLGVAPADGSPFELGGCWEASWSPDSSRIACTWSEDLVIYDVAARTRVTMGRAGAIAWISADEVAIGTPQGEISVLRLSTGERRLLVSALAGAVDFGCPMPAFCGSSSILSPDSQWIAFTVSEGESRDIYLASLRGETIRVTTDGSSERPAWQPRGG